jgi:hypothetical protein
MDAYRLAGDDDLAVTYANEVLRKGTTPDGRERSPMRMAEATLTTAVVAAHKGELEEAVTVGLRALESTRKSPRPSRWQPGELDAKFSRRWPTEPAVQQFREAVRSLR